MRKQMEGDNEQRRAAARDARERGESPSEAGVTTGASKQQRHIGNEASHEEKLQGPGHGKADPSRFTGDGRPREQDDPTNEERS
jgi:hypothetical protein